jgi:GcrA cell cycle regulator
VQIAEVRAERAAARVRPAPEAQPLTPEPMIDDEDEEAVYSPRPIIPAGQPLPPQPSTDEIDPEALATVREVEKTARRLTLLELTERTCKWPIGDPATSDFWFCGLPVKPGKPYCEAHVAVAFQPMSSRRDRRR